jgi:hypothetical protein
VDRTQTHPPRELVGSFALELKRLAALVERSLRRGDDLVALSSLTAIAPLMESLSETVLRLIVAEGTVQESPAVTTDPTLENLGYL